MPPLHYPECLCDYYYDTNVMRIKFAVDAGIFAALSAAAALLIQPTFIESQVAHATLDGLFVGAAVYIGLKILKRTTDPQ